MFSTSPFYVYQVFGVMSTSVSQQIASITLDRFSQSHSLDCFVICQYLLTYAQRIWLTTISLPSFRRNVLVNKLNIFSLDSAI